MTMMIMNMKIMTNTMLVIDSVMMKSNIQVPGGNQPLPGGGPGGPLARFLKTNSVKKDLLLMSTCLFLDTMIFLKRNSNEELMTHLCRGVQGEVPSGQYLSLSCRLPFFIKYSKYFFLKITICCIETSNASPFSGPQGLIIYVLIFHFFYSHLFLTTGQDTP